jgi:hypothetical protein
MPSYTIAQLLELSGLTPEELATKKVADHIYEINGIRYCCPEG